MRSFDWMTWGVIAIIVALGAFVVWANVTGRSEAWCRDYCRKQGAEQFALSSNGHCTCVGNTK